MLSQSHKIVWVSSLHIKIVCLKGTTQSNTPLYECQFSIKPRWQQTFPPWSTRTKCTYCSGTRAVVSTCHCQGEGLSSGDEGRDRHTYRYIKRGRGAVGVCWGLLKLKPVLLTPCLLIIYIKLTFGEFTLGSVIVFFCQFCIANRENGILSTLTNF